MTEIRREMRVYPARDGGKRHWPDRSSPELILAVTDGARAITFCVSTGWCSDELPMQRPQGVAVQYHDTVKHDDSDSVHKNCEWVGAECFHAHLSWALPKQLLELLAASGSDAVFLELEKIWVEQMDKPAAGVDGAS